MNRYCLILFASLLSSKAFAGTCPAKDNLATWLKSKSNFFYENLRQDFKTNLTGNLTFNSGAGTPDKNYCTYVVRFSIPAASAKHEHTYVLIFDRENPRTFIAYDSSIYAGDYLRTEGSRILFRATPIVANTKSTIASFDFGPGGFGTNDVEFRSEHLGMNASLEFLTVDSSIKFIAK